MAQIFVAFGQGVGPARVSEEAALELQRFYLDAIAPRVGQEMWEDQFLQELDRIRAIGRLAAAKAASAGAPAITPREIHESTSAFLETLGTDQFRTDEPDRVVRLRAALASAPSVDAEILNLKLLDDSALWNAAQTRMPQPDSERMEELHRRQRVTGLSEVEAEEVARLERQYERVILVRSHSASLLEKRGHNIRGLTPKLTPADEPGLHP